jgi:hypothetical protein
MHRSDMHLPSLTTTALQPVPSGRLLAPQMAPQLAGRHAPPTTGQTCTTRRQTCTTCMRQTCPTCRQTSAPLAAVRLVPLAARHSCPPRLARLAPAMRSEARSPAAVPWGGTACGNSYMQDEVRPWSWVRDGGSQQLRARCPLQELLVGVQPALGAPPSHRAEPDVAPGRAALCITRAGSRRPEGRAGMQERRMNDSALPCRDGGWSVLWL